MEKSSYPLQRCPRLHANTTSLGSAASSCCDGTPAMHHDTLQHHQGAALYCFLVLHGTAVPYVGVKPRTGSSCGAHCTSEGACGGGGAHLNAGRARWLALADSCRMTTLKAGYQVLSSRSHWRSTVAGETMRVGRKSLEWCSPAKNAATCTPHARHHAPVLASCSCVTSVLGQGLLGFHAAPIE